MACPGFPHPPSKMQKPLKKSRMVASQLQSALTVLTFFLGKRCEPIPKIVITALVAVMTVLGICKPNRHLN